MSQAETIFRYNGAEYEFDIRDADDAERYEKAIANMEKTEAATPKEGNISTIYRAQCSMIKTFFDECLGAGAGIAICTTKDNVSVCYQAYLAFVEFAAKQKDDVLGFKNTFAQYSNRSRRMPKQSSVIPAPADARPGRNGKGGKK